EYLAMIAQICAPFVRRTDLRNHRKIFIADGSLAISGGRNIAAKYLGPGGDDAERWTDLSFVLEGPAVTQYSQIFEADWAFAVGAEERPCEAVGAGAGEAVVQVVPSGPDVVGDPLYKTVISAAYEARQRLWVVTPYFVPDSALQQAFVIACRRGVDVQIIVPARSDHRLTDLARGNYLREIQDAGGKVMLHHGPMLHAKAMIVDDCLAMMGSANMDGRSLFLNYEAVMVMYSEGDIAAAAKWIESIMRASRSGMPPPGVMRAFAEAVVRLFEPLL
ncbi:MAG: cardiolipin synthase, partial [Planctomycetes bacterium]|nr:cardiolipin synthase [Planctomycetota bacterium]